MAPRRTARKPAGRIGLANAVALYNQSDPAWDALVEAAVQKRPTPPLDERSLEYLAELDLIERVFSETNGPGLTKDLLERTPLAKKVAKRGADGNYYIALDFVDSVGLLLRSVKAVKSVLSLTGRCGEWRMDRVRDALADIALATAQHANRGLKIINNAAEGGRIAHAGDADKKADMHRRVEREMRLNPRTSWTRACKKVARDLGLKSDRAVRNATPDLKNFKRPNK